MHIIDKIIVHHSESDIEAHDDIKVIREWHLQRGFYDVGYHYVITKSKGLQIGRDEATSGAHCKGHNYNSIGICLTGDEVFTNGQFTLLAELLNELFQKYDLSFDDVYPHNYYDDGKVCPNFDLLQFQYFYLD